MNIADEEEINFKLGSVRLYSGFKFGHSYKLCKDYNNIVIKESPFINKHVLRLDAKYLKSLPISEEIFKFILVISRNKDYRNFVNLYRNLSYLQVKLKRNRIFNNKAVGYYIPLFNEMIIYSDKYKNTINHELFHVSSTGVDEVGNIFSGFSQCSQNGYFIGNGIDEGYTELLTNRYFGKVDDNFYVFESLVMSLVEEIVGKDKMEQLYFQGNLYGLIVELKKYSSERETLLFIRNLDYYNSIYISKMYLFFYKNELIKCLNDIANYLFKTFYTKQLIESDYIDMDKVFEFSKKLKKGLYCNNKRIYYFSMGDENSIKTQVSNKYSLTKKFSNFDKKRTV